MPQAGQLDTTHDPSLKSWVSSANDATADFPIQNLPFGVFGRGASDEGRVGVAIGDRVVDLVAVHAAGLLMGDAEVAARHCAVPRLNNLMALEPRYRSALRAQLSTLLREGSQVERTPGLADRVLVRADDIEMRVPAAIGDYTDFYASVYHATNVGAMFRPDNPLLPNYKWVPIGYHGRSSSIVPSGMAVRRPRGQAKASDDGTPTVGLTHALDYEVELGLFVGVGNPLGTPITIDAAEDHLFGVCLVNDWSARDIQTWEYQPLGPFLAKNFATSVSPWVVTMEALAPFRVAPFVRPEGDPAPLPYLTPREQERTAINLQIDVLLLSRQMRERGIEPERLSRSNTRDLYWTPGQLLAHHASNGCNLRSGDLLASGTVSGATRDALGCLLELTRRGATPITLPTGEKRTFLEDGDEVILRGSCARPGAVRIGLGECRGMVMPGPQTTTGT
jgi:fumarylacetoacetase